MIVDKYVAIKMNGKHISKYRKLGYVCNVNDIIDVCVKDIPRLSSIKVLVSCDLCNNENNVFFSSYTKSIENGGYYNCHKCKSKKTKKTCLKKYGVESYTQTNEYLERTKKTNLEKYGVESYTQTNEYLERTKKTNLEKYGVENVFQSEIIKDRIKETCLEKYGVNHVMKSDIVKSTIKKNNLYKYGVSHTSKLNIVKNKIKKTNINKYGVENVFQSEIIKDRIKETCLEKYGVYHAMKSDIIKKKLKGIILDKYGFENVGQNEFIKSKIKNSRVLNGNWISDEERTPFETYKKDVRNKTKILKKILFENWDGYDYYDNEFIKLNSNLIYTNRFYPTIDHKISIFSGYINNMCVDNIACIENLCITKRYLNSKKID